VTDPAVYIWVRATVDWRSGEAVRPEFQPPVDLWNETFTLPFHRFRYRVHEIARLNHSKVDGAVRAPWDEIPAGALVLPVDDDDWFSPDAAQVLASEFDSRLEGYYWTSTSVEIPRNFGHRFYLARLRLFPWTRPRWVCATNNYAMLKSDATKTPLTWHTKASQRFERSTLGHTARPVKEIDRRLSIFNRTLGSQTSLIVKQSSIGRRRLIRKYRRYRRLYDQPPVPELEWCRPYLEMMSALMEELEIRNGR
jgi:hypothetical protein